MPELQAAVPPFKTDSPPWYNNGIWGVLGCAVPQTGKYIHTANAGVLSLVNTFGRQLFQTMWKYDDRRIESYVSRDCMWEIYQLLIVGRSRINAMTIPPGQSPPSVTHGTPGYQMFVLYPVPLYGRLGCVQPFLNYALQKGLMALTEAMEHSDNDRDDFVTINFAQSVLPYLQAVLIKMATSHFGYTREEASAVDFAIPDERWGPDPVKGYNPTRYGVPVEATSTRTPVGWKPTEQDLEPIRGIPASKVIPFCQPWPDSTLYYSPGGVWAGQTGNENAAPGSDTPGSGNVGASGSSLPSGSFVVPNGPPN